MTAILVANPLRDEEEAGPERDDHNGVWIAAVVSLPTRTGGEVMTILEK